LSFSSFSEAFFLLAIGSHIFLFLSATAVFFAELFLVLCLSPCRHHHHHFLEFAVLEIVLGCVLFFGLLPFGGPQVLLFIPDL
jgi:hypothetical protein